MGAYGLKSDRFGMEILTSRYHSVDDALITLKSDRFGMEITFYSKISLA